MIAKTTCLVVLLIGATWTASAYHIDGTKTGAAPDVRSSDWIFEPTPPGPGEPDYDLGEIGRTRELMKIPASTKCEAEFGYGVAPGGGRFGSDDQDPMGAPLGRPGFSQLCLTGRNDATGTPKPAAMLGKGVITRLDACSLRTSERNLPFAPAEPPGPLPIGPAPYPVKAPWAGLGPYGAGALCPTHRGTIAWQATLGVFTCTIPVVAPVNIGVVADYGLYYEELYAWWSWGAAPGPLTSGDAPGLLHGGTDSDPITPGHQPSADGPPAMGGAKNNEDAFHGHVLMVIDAARSAIQPTNGSAEAVPYGGWGAVPGSTAWKDGPDPPEGGPYPAITGGWPNNCGASPCGDPARKGPVCRAP